MTINKKARLGTPSKNTWPNTAYDGARSLALPQHRPMQLSTLTVL
jgi:hypothetical protein